MRGLVRPFLSTPVVVWALCAALQRKGEVAAGADQGQPAPEGLSQIGQVHSLPILLSALPRPDLSRGRLLDSNLSEDSNGIDAS